MRPGSRTVWLATLWLCVPTHVDAAPAGPKLGGAKPPSATQEAATAIDELRLEDAEKLLDAAAQAHPDDAAVLYQKARWIFHLGDYAQAVELATRAVAGARPGARTRNWSQMLELMQATEEVTRDYERKSSADGRYVVTYPPGKDGLLAPYALDVLAAADRALSAAFGLSMPGPIRLEIYPSPKTLARVSALTEEQIRTTGTVALSKWSRLMITSPRALVRGYPWADTIGHEFVHLVLSRVTGERAPVWLQEGTAKLFERAWRGPDAKPRLDPVSAAMLAKAAAEDDLVTFDEMHPSIAMLPSEDDAMLAFAEVATFMTRYVERHGGDAFRAALVQIASGADAREALASVVDSDFGALEADWKRSLPKRADGDAPRPLKLRFRDAKDGKDGEERDESEEVGAEEARRFVRLGDLLWDRGRFGGATTEYRKALKVGLGDPIVAARFGRAALQAGDAKGALAALEPQLARYPNHAPTHAMLGAARLRTGDRVGAVTALREAIRINPFDPQPHCDLAEAATESQEAERERRVCAELR